jgi:hypothetical protein
MPPSGWRLAGWLAGWLGWVGLGWLRKGWDMGQEKTLIKA